ncbi:efflux RND transporter permease subunit [Allorhodopirellula solitaria]|uniref:Cation efflux system protein CusA n=1 Tax=Allorhodopirellula solitaria TaxID=2527987 RepID=A0A5C5XTA6_9BACT|nr:efflux RND transporter permease subunit [Allorhodopirellula solitaria]TWT66140.1 Cation efflux system protein CusA [Allorhodopirellula solitaria]
MLNLIIRFCVKEPWLVMLMTIGVTVFGWYSYNTVPIDAIPNVGENQVIVLTPWPGRSPKDIEDQITYPLSVSLSAVPHAKSVRGKSLFGSSFVQVTFADDVDFYWARSRVSEQLGTVAAQLPAGVTPRLGPDATGLGQVYYYVLVPPEEGRNLADLRSLQDFVVKYDLQAVEGVSEVASIGGYVRQYQIEVDPDKLRFHGISLEEVIQAVRGSNLDVGAKTVESGGMEFIVRGKGFLGSDGDVQQAIADIEDAVILQREGVPVRIQDIAAVQLGPDFRRGALDYNGAEAVGGVVVMRHGENPREVIERVKAKIQQIEPALDGVKIQGIYDRTGLINETIATLSTALRDEILITAVVILLFLLHLRSSFIVAVTLPVAVLLSFIAMNVLGVGANIMSLAGIAIAIGTMVDMAIIVSENIYQHLAERESADAHERSTAPKERSEIICEAAIEVAPAVVTAVATTIVSFLPVFFLTGRDYKLFAPLAMTKTFAISAALIATLTIVPALSRLLLRSASHSRRKAWTAGVAGGFLFGATAYFVWGHRVASEWAMAPSVAIASLAGFVVGWVLTRERIRPPEQNWVSRGIVSCYRPVLRLVLQHKAAFLTLPLAIVLAGFGGWVGFPALLAPLEKAAQKLGVSPNELPGYVDFKHTFTGLKSDDWIALDEGSWFYMPTLYPAASFSQAMQILQTQDVLIGEIPEVQDVLGKIGRIDSALDPAPAAMVETYVMLKPKQEWRAGVTSQDIWDEINQVATLPGVTPASPLQPIEGRVVMLQSGIKASMAIRIYGDDLHELADAALQVSEQLKQSAFIQSNSVNPDIVLGKPYLEFSVDREAASRYGMTAERVNQVIESALGGVNLITTVEERERYPVRLRYNRDLRERIDQLDRLPVVAPSGAVVPLGELAQLTTTWGPGAINSENSRLVAHVSFATTGIQGDIESISAIEEELLNAQSLPQDDPNHLSLPPGYSLEAVGSFRNQIEANNRLMWLVPLVIGINLLIIYLQFRQVPITLAVFAGIPVAFGGGMILLAIVGAEMNTAIWVGFIALFGIAVDDGVVMATYLDQLFTRRRPQTVAGIRAATMDAGVRRIRPCLMTTATTLVALVPVLIATGRGADVARAMALPVFGGMAVELVTLFVVPVVYCGFKEFQLHMGALDHQNASPSQRDHRATLTS